MPSGTTRGDIYQPLILNRATGMRGDLASDASDRAMIRQAQLEPQLSHEWNRQHCHEAFVGSNDQIIQNEVLWQMFQSLQCRHPRWRLARKTLYGFARSCGAGPGQEHVPTKSQNVGGPFYTGDFSHIPWIVTPILYLRAVFPHRDLWRFPASMMLLTAP